MNTAILITNLGKTYQTTNVKTKAVQDVSFAIDHQESIAIVGKSGSGKSTLLHMLGGLETPTSGEVILDGKSIYKLPKSERCNLRREKIGFVFQFFNLIPELSVYENIILPIIMDNNKIDEHYIRTLVDLLSISDKLYQYPQQLSGGQQQRAAIARALANQPTVLLADEPTGNLDEGSGSEVLSLFKRCQQELGQTMVVVTHDLEVAKHMDRVITLKDGQMISDVRKAVAT